ncbi:MAG: hypothetical protein JF626_00920 [Polaromonas sp.]|nr:hypothetical protein [Polaromonas sp.]
MLASEILNHLATIPDVNSVSVHYVNRTRGETEENYAILGNYAEFQSIASFAATALRALAEHMGCTENDLSGLEVESCEPASWMHHYNATLLPGAALCFPPVSVLGFEPPAELQRRLYLVPHLSGMEESFVCQSAKHYVLLYWHTTG